jgi:hypothetical protein
MKEIKFKCLLSVHDFPTKFQVWWWLLKGFVSNVLVEARMSWVYLDFGWILIGLSCGAFSSGGKARNYEEEKRTWTCRQELKAGREKGELVVKTFMLPWGLAARFNLGNTHCEGRGFVLYHSRCSGRGPEEAIFQPGKTWNEEAKV